MKFTPTSIPEVIVIDPKVLKDDRGYFFESFRADIFSREIPGVYFIQDNESMSSYGVLRGLHYQLPPFAQAKLVRVVSGAVLDVAVDIRRQSPYFGQHTAIELSGQNKRQVFIPRGFAHGFIVLGKTAVFQYKVDNRYSRDHERGIAFDDPALGIDWQVNPGDRVLSDKDRLNPPLSGADLFEYQGPRP